jgi:ribulose-5-phosphate 4-epimerase/fuculose-1-phosphate aldolase
MVGTSETEKRIAAIVEELVLANRILLHHKVVDAFGHVSSRHPAQPDRFLLARRLAPGLVHAEDIREFGMDGELIDKDGTPTFLERYIHSAIYAARPDVHSVVHSHSDSVLSFSVVPSQPLRAVCHTATFLGDGAPVFEIRDAAGTDSNLLISNQVLGEALAKSLGKKSVVLMRGHGSTVVGGSVPQAVYCAVYTKTNAQVQAAAMALGPVIYLSAGEAETGDRSASVAIERTWDFWTSELATS